VLRCAPDFPRELFLNASSRIRVIKNARLGSEYVHKKAVERAAGLFGNKA